MNNLINNTFGGLSTKYYLRQLFFGALISALLLAPILYSNQQPSIDMVFYTVVCTLLYPYSRFIYEKMVSFIIGNNVFFLNAIVMLMAKVFTMLLCYTSAIFIAPIGLLYLYFYNRKKT